MDLTRTIRLSIDSRAECIELISGAISGITQLIPLSAAQRDHIELAVVEAVNNAVEHAYQQQPGHSVIVECQLMPDQLNVRVYDEGRGMNPLMLAAADDFATIDPLDPESWNYRGRGLAIIRTCMDVVTYSTCQGINMLEMSIQLSRDLSGLSAHRREM